MITATISANKNQDRLSILFTYDITASAWPAHLTAGKSAGRLDEAKHTQILLTFYVIIFHMNIWDYKINKNWQPKTTEEWQWYLVRKINTDDLIGINKAILEKYFPLIKERIDIGKKNLIEYFLK